MPLFKIVVVVVVLLRPLTHMVAATAAAMVLLDGHVKDTILQYKKTWVVATTILLQQNHVKRSMLPSKRAKQRNHSTLT
jgi:hypothetical protein